jgi:hypothetical protein
MADAAEGVHRLKDILVEEVSLVDRAANKRRFLVVKREGGEMSELRSNGRGGFTRVMKADDTDDEETKARKAAEEAEKAKGKPFPGAAKPFGKPGEGEPPKKDDEDDEETKAKKAAEKEEDEKALKVLEAAGLTEAAKRLGKADPQGMKLAKEVSSLADALTKVAEDLKGEEEDEPSDVHMKKILAAHKKMGAMCDKYMRKVGKAAIEKVGAKMAGARLNAFKEALGNLQSILSELMETPGSVKEHAADPGDPTMPAKGFKASNPSDAPTNAMGEAAVKAMLEKVMSDVVEPLVEANKNLVARLSKVEKGVVPSNSIPVEKRGGGPRGGAGIAWPMDMNEPVKGDVKKSESFFDVD